jgi:hypothetical protein
MVQARARSPNAASGAPATATSTISGCFSSGISISEVNFQGFSDCRLLGGVLYGKSVAAFSDSQGLQTAAYDPFAWQRSAADEHLLIHHAPVGATIDQ